ARALSEVPRAAGKLHSSPAEPAALQPVGRAYANLSSARRDAIVSCTNAHRVADLSRRHTDHRGNWRFGEDAWEDSRTRVSGPTQWVPPMPTLRTLSQCSAIEG